MDEVVFPDSSHSLASANQGDDLNLISRFQPMLLMTIPRDQIQIDLHRHVLGLHAERPDQLRNRDLGVDLTRFAIQLNSHGRES